MGYDYFFQALYFYSFGLCRLGPIFYLLPFINSGTLPVVLKMPIMILMSFALMPLPSLPINELEPLFIVIIVIKEVIIGLVLGCILSLPFWVFHATGSFIDNQRGATLSSTLDPSTGVDTSELAKFINMLSVVIYLDNNGLVHLSNTVYISYQILKPLTLELPELYLFIDFLSKLMFNTIQLASPVIAVMLGAEIFLGMLSRYASQLNAFSISLTIKSGLAFIILLLYLYPTFFNRFIEMTPSIKLIESYFKK